MKQIFFLILFLITLKAVDFSELEPIYEADFEKFDKEFEPFQSSNSAESTPQVITEGSDSVLYFSGIPTKYSGYISSDWISSESGGFYILIQFKGELNLRTGGYIGYMRDDQLNIQRTIGLDANINMDFFQIYRFNTTGQWNTYIAYLKFTPGVKIKIILEKGNYFGLTENRDAKFKNLKVYDFELCQDGECPATDEAQKILQLGYYTFVFFNNQLEYKIFADVDLTGRPKVNNEGTLTVKYPHPPDCCVKAAFYMRDATGGIIEAFNPLYSMDVDFTNSLINDQWKFDFTMSEIEDFKCTQTATTNSNGDPAVLHTCDIEIHFYYDYDMTFNTHKDEFDYSSKNSQGIFRSQFYIMVSKDTETIFNTYVQTLEIDAVCTGICQLDFAMELDLFYATNPNGPYTNADTTVATPQTLTWGDHMSFKITSTPSTYDLKLMKVVVTTNGGTSTLGSIFIDSYIQNVKATTGELYFEMMISGEAGLQLGKTFNLQFLTKSSTRRLLEDEEELPKAQISGGSGFIAVKASIQLALGFISSFLFLLILLL